MKKKRNIDIAMRAKNRMKNSKINTNNKIPALRAEIMVYKS